MTARPAARPTARPAGRPTARPAGRPGARPRAHPVGRVLLAYALSAVAIGLPWPLLLVLVHDEYAGRPHAALLLGLTGAARMLPYVLLSWAAGSVGDRVRRDRLVRLTLVARVGLFAVAAVGLADGRVLLAVAACSLAVAVATPSYPALAASLPALAGAGRRRATDALVTIEVSSWVVGPAVGGLLLLPATRAFVLPAALMLVAVAWVLLLGLRLPGPERRERPETLAGQAAPASVPAMLRAVAASPPVLAALAAAALLNLVESGVALALLPLADRVWGTGDAGFGLALAWLGFGALGAPLLWWLPGGAVARRVRGLVGLAAAMALVALVPGPVALPLLAGAGALGVLVESAATETIQDGVADAHRAGALGLADSVMVGSALIGSLVSPLVADRVDPRVLVLAAAALAAVGALRRTTWSVGAAAATSPALPSGAWEPHCTSRPPTAPPRPTSPAPRVPT